MEPLLQLDTAFLRWITSVCRSDGMDVVMRVFSSTQLGVLLFFTAVAFLWRKGGKRGLVLAGFLAFGLATADPLLSAPLKHWVKRERPHRVMEDLRIQGGAGGGYGMPSSHAVNAFLAAGLTATFYRRARFVAGTLAGAVGFSRVYNGMHYPSDVLCGALLGFAYARLLLFVVPRIWSFAGPRWFPWGYSRLPDLMDPAATDAKPVAPGVTFPASDLLWLRLGYVVIAACCGVRWLYLAAGKIELSEDEAYQWLWSKHLALSYYSKPPLIAWSHWLGTSIWGDREFGLRFFSPLITALGSLILMRFLAREASARAGFWFVVASLATPLLGVGAILMTIDPLNVFFWAAAMVTGWRALKDEGLRWWAMTGVLMGFGFLSKYTALFQWLSFAVFLACWPEARRTLRKPGLYLALGIQALFSIPVLLWNSQNGWITLTHLSERSGLDRDWSFTTRFFLDFIMVEPLVLNPVFFLGMLVAGVALWKRPHRRPLEVYLFSMGAPLFLFYFAYTLRARVQPNWIAPSVLPLLALMVVYWESREKEGARWAIAAGRWAVAVMLPLLIVAHDTNLVSKVTGKTLPVRMDPLRRLRGWSEMALVVEGERQRMASGGKDWFIIGEHYGVTSMLSFYMPGAKANADPFVYFRSSPIPLNQFFFWPGYVARKGENAIFVQQVEEAQPPPPSIVGEFASVEDLGLREVFYRGRPIRKIQLFACRGLK